MVIHTKWTVGDTGPYLQLGHLALRGDVPDARRGVRPGIIHVVWSCLPCSQSTLWSVAPNDVDDTGPCTMFTKYFMVIHTK
jgi:hypothetical protein